MQLLTNYNRTQEEVNKEQEEDGGLIWKSNEFSSVIRK